MWLRGATVARLTPDQKVACSNHVGVNDNIFFCSLRFNKYGLLDRDSEFSSVISNTTHRPNFISKLTVAPVNPGAPDASSFSLSASTSMLLFLAISSKYLFQSVNESLGLFLQKVGKSGVGYMVTQQQRVSWLGDLIVRSIYLNRNIPACSSTVETAFNVAICPRGKWLNKWINLIAEQTLVLSLEGISGASIWWLYCRIIFIIYCTRNVMLCYPPAHRPLRDFMLNEFFSERSFLS